MIVETISAHVELVFGWGEREEPKVMLGLLWAGEAKGRMKKRRRKVTEVASIACFL